jgi:hypothetical protein
MNYVLHATNVCLNGVISNKISYISALMKTCCNADTNNIFDGEQRFRNVTKVTEKEIR